MVRPRHAARAVYRWTRRAVRGIRHWWISRRKVVRIRYRLSWATFRKILTPIPAAVFIAFITYSLVNLISGTKGPVERRCESTGACGPVIGFTFPFLSLALAASVFLLYRYWRIKRPLMRKAKHQPQRLVAPAGRPVERIVGREQLCQVICRSLGDPWNRRPYILVGGVGSGKTAVLIQLTQMLAQQGRVPVPIRLRQAGTNGCLDFRELARQTFTEESDPGAFLSSEQGTKVWRQLCNEGRAVVIADGLEEALTTDGQLQDRDNVIRRAIDRAERQKLPLVIASRPHAPLQDTYASVIDLEPLSEEAALDFLAREDPEPDAYRLDWIVETAVVSESPLYMEITHELAQHHLLKHLQSARSASSPLDTRSRDRSTLRLRLLETWKTGLMVGHLHENVALTQAERSQSVRVLSALATIGLLRDSLHVHYDELLDPEKSVLKGKAELIEAAKKLQKKLHDAQPGLDPQKCASEYALQASRGEQLGLVESWGDGVSFPHSILQAYLGSEFLPEVKAHLVKLLRSTDFDFGRELLISLVLRSCREERDFLDGIPQLLKDAAENRQDSKGLDLFAAALEVDLHAQAAAPRRVVSIHKDIADGLGKRWWEIATGDPQSRDEAKERLVHRYGEVLREIARRRNLPEEDRDKWPTTCAPLPAYDQFLKLAFQEESYALRLAITQEVGAGGDAAFEALRAFFSPDQKDPVPDPMEQYTEQLKEPREALRQLNAKSSGEGRSKEEQEEYRRERDKIRKRKGNVWRQFATRASTVPMVVGSVGIERREDAAERLDAWLKHLDPTECKGGRADLPLSFEVALAQGFKSAANRRRRHPDTNDDTRELLIEKAEIMLSRSRYWFSQLTLIHALCLWELPDRLGRAATTKPNEDDDEPGRSQTRPAADPYDAVQRWLKLAGSERALTDRREEDHTRRGERLHPFVSRAADLAVLALETGRPEQYIWIDEKGVMEKVGSTTGDPRFFRKHNLWIPPSVGWSSLDPRAQQLLADVLLLLNLTERDNGGPDLIESRLQRSARNSLPPCLTKDRSPLQPKRTVGMAHIAEPGNTCLRDCPFELCPYPPKGGLPRAELHEVFCLQQQALLRWRRGRFPLYAVTRKRAPWQGMTCKELRQFWGQMAERTRTPRP
ncbi:NACHT domain-containing protein [Streptomyces sp. NPDC085900]|uniref:NACHT domain-containing protein n=1 Tax=Streptomyces sp. NPDC085900 TaxID=3365737 RepID=UPI0037CCFD97